MINAEIQANNNRAQALASEQNAKVVQNVAAGVVGIVVWPVLFAMDAKGAASTAAAALQARQEYLSNLATQRCATTLQIQDQVGMSPKMIDRYCRFADKKANGKAAVIALAERRKNAGL
jgi:hypothetical protein